MDFKRGKIWRNFNIILKAFDALSLSVTTRTDYLVKSDELLYFS